MFKYTVAQKNGPLTTVSQKGVEHFTR